MAQVFSRNSFLAADASAGVLWPSGRQYTMRVLKVIGGVVAEIYEGK